MTGVQTCALPISSLEILSDEQGRYVYVDLLPGESINITVDGYTSVLDSGVALG